MNTTTTPQPTKFLVQVENQGNKFWLGGTVWRFSVERATLYDTTEAAQAALDKARKFMVAKIYRAAVILPVEQEASTDPLDDFNYVGSRHHY